MLTGVNAGQNETPSTEACIPVLYMCIHILQPQPGRHRHIDICVSRDGLAHCFNLQRKEETAVNSHCGLPYGLNLSSTLPIKCWLGGGAESSTTNYCLPRPQLHPIHPFPTLISHALANTPPKPPWTFNSLRITIKPLITIPKNLFVNSLVIINISSKSMVITCQDGSLIYFSKVFWMCDCFYLIIKIDTKTMQ